MINNPLLIRPPMFDPSDYLTADLSALRWMTGADRMAVVAARVALLPKARPQYIAPEEPGVLYTHYQTGAARPAVQIDATDHDVRSREEVKQSTKPLERMYEPQRG